MSSLPNRAHTNVSGRSDRPTLDDGALRIVFDDARTHSAWLDRPVEPALLQRAYELARLGPTGGNASPLRIAFVTSAESKDRILPTLNPMNVEKVRTAPVTAILAWDRTYWEKLPQLFPARPEMRDKLAGLPAEIQERLGQQSAYLAAGYFILAARALGLDCGPLGGFDPSAVDAAFFPDGAWGSLLICNLGYGDSEKLYPRLPRLSFEEACRVL